MKKLTFQDVRELVCDVLDVSTDDSPEAEVRIDKAAGALWVALDDAFERGRAEGEQEILSELKPRLRDWY